MSSTPRSTQKPEVHPLEDRTLPAVFSPSPLAADGDEGSLRAAIIIANANADASNTFRLAAGVYTLSVANTLGQENAAAQGDLDLTASGKTYVFRGRGRSATVIDAADLDRVFQVFPDARVEFHDLTIQNGLATDDGTAGGGLTAAFGGGILSTAGRVLLENVAVRGNEAAGRDGIDGTSGDNGTPGAFAAGGGISSFAGTVTLRGSTRVVENRTEGGDGGDGGLGSQDSLSGGNGGDGGFGADARGGGLDVLGTDLTISGCVIADNRAQGGLGGRGGDGYTESGAESLRGGGGGGGGGGAIGGGLFVDAIDFMIKASSVAGNVAQGGGGGDGGNGGINFGSNDNLTGGAGGAGGTARGGGLATDDGTGTVFACTFSTNQALGGTGGDGGDGGEGGDDFGNDGLQGGAGGQGGEGRGGGAYVEGGAALTSISSTVSGNLVRGGDGGGGGAGGVGSSEINQTTGAGGDGGAGGNGRGGGLYVTESSDLQLFNSTVARNRAQASTGGGGGEGVPNGADGSNGRGEGGGVYFVVTEGNGVVFSRSSLIGDNFAASTGSDFRGIVRAAASLIEDAAGVVIIPLGQANIVGLDPAIAPLAFNGGETQTHALLPNSPARATGSNPLNLKADQRGRRRVNGCLPDIGAVERSGGDPDAISRDRLRRRR